MAPQDVRVRVSPWVAMSGGDRPSASYDDMAVAGSAWATSIDRTYDLFEVPEVRAKYRDLAPKVEAAVRACEAAVDEFGIEHCALSFNGGKDCRWRDLPRHGPCAYPCGGAAPARRGRAHFCGGPALVCAVRGK